MEDNWESEDFVPAIPFAAKENPKSVWDEEDVEDEEVNESWEDEDQPAPVSTPEPETFAAKPEKKKVSEGKGKNSKVEDGSKSSEIKRKGAKIEDEKLADPLAEKLCQQRLVEGADYQSTAELFGKRTR